MGKREGAEGWMWWLEWCGVGCGGVGGAGWVGVGRVVVLVGFLIFLSYHGLLGLGDGLAVCFLSAVVWSSGV